jgi:large subunit ribosomal protein L10
VWDVGGIAAERLLHVQRAFFFVGLSCRGKEESRLPINRNKKSELLEEYKVQIAKSSALVFTNFRGMPVSKLRSLRAKLGETDNGYMVVKNTLLRIALEQSGREAPESLLTGPNAVAFIGEDIGRGVKSIMDWIKAEKAGEITGALLGNSPLNAANAEALAELPTKEQMLANVLGAINAPATAVARMVTAPGASLVRVINARVEQQQGGAA